MESGESPSIVRRPLSIEGRSAERREKGDIPKTPNGFGWDCMTDDVAAFCVNRARAATKGGGSLARGGGELFDTKRVTSGGVRFALAGRVRWSRGERLVNCAVVSRPPYFRPNLEIWPNQIPLLAPLATR